MKFSYVSLHISFVKDIEKCSLQFEGLDMNVNLRGLDLCNAAVVEAHIQGVTERRGQCLGTSSAYQHKKKCPCQHVSGNI
jgi:hypothetical protein